MFSNKNLWQKKKNIYSTKIFDAAALNGNANDLCMLGEKRTILVENTCDFSSYNIFFSAKPCRSRQGRW